jgi:sugar phosphate isomerase/epimerase
MSAIMSTDSGVLGIGISISVDDPNGQDLSRKIEEVLGSGVTFVELPLFQLDLVASGRIVKQRLDAVSSITRTHNARYTLHGHLSINLMDEPERLALHQLVLAANIEIASQLNAAHLVVHSGLSRAKDSAGFAEACARQRDALFSAGELARPLGVTLCVENIFDYVGKRRTTLPSELASELAEIGHPNVMATFDFSHGALCAAAMGVDFIPEAQQMCPCAKHLHIHDSFGRPADFWTFTQTEALAFGVGDLHLPVGWGTVPFSEIASKCQFPAGIIAIIELEKRYWSELGSTILATQSFIQMLAVSRQ